MKGLRRGLFAGQQGQQGQAQVADSAKPFPAQPGEEPLDGALVLRELSGRWRAANTVEYRSRAAMDHLNEPRIEVEIHARLRRPSLGRLLIKANRAEYSRLRVSDGRRVRDRTAPTSVRKAYTRSYAYAGSMTADLAHPADYAAYSVNQFFARYPFYPPPEWGDTEKPVEIKAVRYPFKDPKTGQRRNRIRLTFERGWARDEIVLDGLSYEPFELRRVGYHGGIIQLLLHETFEKVMLAPSLPDSLFYWSAEDESGRILRG
ncbi:MAG: hypothetical protein OHK0029_14420 [Armatimonadaceae bacterium]